MKTEWFRNSVWNDETEKVFEEKLRRAKRKEQYLRIQACTLASSNPRVALSLLDRYFKMTDDFDHAQAHVDRATALLALGRTDDAMDAYEAALKREKDFPQLQTHAYIDLPYLIATSRTRERYGRALELLNNHKSRRIFPVDLFQWHAAYALISNDLYGSEVAKENAKQALLAASQEKSGFRYHPTIGLVTERHKSVIEKLNEILAR